MLLLHLVRCVCVLSAPDPAGPEHRGAQSAAAGHAEWQRAGGQLQLPGWQRQLAVGQLALPDCCKGMIGYNQGTLSYPVTPGPGPAALVQGVMK